MEKYNRPARMVLYRGILKSCNYSCSYCPFSKHPVSQAELAHDQKQWESFVRIYEEKAWMSGIRALMLVPYGEALIHAWYWEGLARISALPWTDAVGAQTNLSFPAARSLEAFQKAGGVLKKLRLWATFHPQMTGVSEFAQNCRTCLKYGVSICAGAVGVPENTGLLRQLRRQLPQQVYVWINKMDGLGRAYTEEEKKAFLDIDPYFYRELSGHPADVQACRDRLFVQADGTLRLCCLSTARDAGAGAYVSSGRHAESQPLCRRRQCSCYLAYGGMQNLINDALFGPYPLFRIPRRPKAVFLDIEGTLCRTGADGIPEDIRAGLKVLVHKEKTRLFFATTLPYEDAARRCKSIWHLSAGGVFAGGAHILIKGILEQHHVLDGDCVPYVRPLEQQYRFRLITYQKEGNVYKLTLLRARKHPWDSRTARELMEHIPEQARTKIRYIIEKNCLQLLAAGADKESGVRMICSRMHLQPQEVFAAGDSGEDAGMLAWCGQGLAPDAP